MRISDWSSDVCSSDLVISLHCPLNQQNKEFVNKQLLAVMKPSAYLINTSRGPLLHEADVAEALNSGRIAGAGLDVLSTEPPSPDNPLLQAVNCLITPHIAWASRASRRSEERRVGKECVSTGRSRRWANHSTKNKNKKTD